MTDNHLTPLPERNLDVLRTVAVMSVLLDHSFMAASAFDMRAVGRAGVLLFFVHTSLVLMGSLERGGQHRGWVKAFYVRRAFRIYPLAIATILLILALRIPWVVPVVHNPKVYVAPTLSTVAANLLLVQNLVGVPNVLGVLWSLPVEIEMYVALPLCYIVARKSPRLLGAAILGAALLGMAFRADVIPGLWRLTVLEFGPCFLSGVLAYSLLKRGDVRQLIPSIVWLPTIVALVALFAALARADLRYFPMEWAMCLLVACAIPLTRDLPESRLTKLAATVARYSYGIYLLHLVAFWVAFNVLNRAPGVVQWCVAATFVIALPIGAFRWIESPGIQFGKRFAQGPDQSAGVIPAP